jgi:uncharacterized damage-inducible protein DinB
MTDRKPPKLVDDERATLHALLQFQRESVLRKVDGLDDDTARCELVASSTTLLWLVQHLAYAETLWIVHRFAGRAIDAPRTDTDLATAIADYRATWARVDAITDAAGLDDLCRDMDGDEEPVSLRWVLMHLLEETARHAGHADILRELIDGTTGR